MANTAPPESEQACVNPYYIRHVVAFAAESSKSCNKKPITLLAKKEIMDLIDKLDAMIESTLGFSDERSITSLKELVENNTALEG